VKGIAEWDWKMDLQDQIVSGFDSEKWTSQRGSHLKGGSGAAITDASIQASGRRRQDEASSRPDNSLAAFL